MERELIIKVRENAFKPLLDRDNVESFIHEQLRPWTELVYDLANYGSNLIPRCFGSSDHDLKDAVIIGILLRQVVAMLDALHVLLERGATHAANLQLRALFEASVYVDFMFLGDAEKKARYYYVHNLRRKRVWGTRILPGHPESGEFASMLGKYNMAITQQQQDSEKLRMQEIDRVLSQASLADVNKDIESYRKGKREPAWYVPLGHKSFAAVTRAVDQYALYMFLYSGASEVMHSSSYDQHVKMSKDEATSRTQITFQPIRSIEGFQTVLRFALVIAISTFRKILKQYRPGELEAFGRKYVENWQKEFLDFPKIDVKVQNARI